MFTINHRSVNSTQVISWMLQCVCYTSGHYHYNYVFSSCFFLAGYRVHIPDSLVPKYRLQSLSFTHQALLGVLIILEALWEPEHLPVPITLWFQSLLGNLCLRSTERLSQNAILRMPLNDPCLIPTLWTRIVKSTQGLWMYPAFPRRLLQRHQHPEQLGEE